jgi:hypothetical protein
MKQQVNLFQPIFRRQKKVFTAIAMLQVGLIALFFLGVTAGYSMLQLQRLRDQDQAAAQNLGKLKIQIESLDTGSRDQQQTKLLEAEISRISREIDNKQRIADLLKQGNYTNTQGFTRHFTAIARQHLDGTWLKAINITSGGSTLNLDGVTFSADLVPAYLERLLQEEVFTGMSFNVLGMERSETRPEELLFQVGTQIKDKPDERS